MTETDLTPVSVLDALDPVPVWLVERAAPLRIAVAETPGEREAIFRLRYEFARQAGWDVGEDSTSELERDAWDDDAVHIAAWDGELLAGACRVVFPNPARPLPTEAAFGLTVQPEGRVIEQGRQIVAERYRGDPLHRASMALLGRAWLEARRGNYEVWTATAATPIVAMCRRLGIEVEVLAPPKQVLGEERLPIRFDMARAAPRLAAFWRQFGGPEV